MIYTYIYIYIYISICIFICIYIYIYMYFYIYLHLFLYLYQYLYLYLYLDLHYPYMCIIHFHICVSASSRNAGSLKLLAFCRVSGPEASCHSEQPCQYVRIIRSGFSYQWVTQLNLAPHQSRQLFLRVQWLVMCGCFPSNLNEDVL